MSVLPTLLAAKEVGEAYQLLMFDNIVNEDLKGLVDEIHVTPTLEGLKIVLLESLTETNGMKFPSFVYRHSRFFSIDTLYKLLLNTCFWEQSSEALQSYTGAGDSSDSNNVSKAEMVVVDESDGDDVIDFEILGALREAMGDAFVELIPVFVQQVDEYKKDIFTRLDEGDQETVRRIVHSMKSSCYNMGAVNLSQQAKALEEKIAEQGLVAGLKEKIVVLMNEYDRVRETLIEYNSHQ